MRAVPELCIPATWIKTTLSDTRRDDVTGIDPAKHSDEVFDLYSIPAYEFGVPERVMGRDIGSTKKLLTPGTVVLSKINPRINRVWVVSQSHGLRQIGSSEWISFSPIEGLVPAYLAHYLRQDRFRIYLGANVSGVGGSLMRVNAAVVDRYPLALPPTHEQERIVEALDSYLSRLEDSVASLDRVQAKLQRYRNSVLKAAVGGLLVPTEAFLARAEKRDYEPADALLARILKERRVRWEEGELAKLKVAGRMPTDDKWRARYEEPVAPDTNTLPELPEGWCWARTEQICDFITKGTTPQNSQMASGSGDVPFIKVYNLTFDGSLDFSVNPTFIDRATHGSALARSICFPGDVLMNIVGPPLGKVSIVPPTHAEWNINQAIARFRPLRGILGLYLVYVLLGGQALEWAKKRSKATAGQFNLTLETSRDIPIPVPPEPEQHRIVAEIERQLSVAASVKETALVDHRRARRLRQAVLKWAFEGKLIDQDPIDEPAEKLLARIRAERASAAPARKSRGRKARGAE